MGHGSNYFTAFRWTNPGKNCWRAVSETASLRAWAQYARSGLMDIPACSTRRPWHFCSSGTACSGLTLIAVTVQGLMRGLARDLGMGPAMGLEGIGVSPVVGSQATALVKGLSSVFSPTASARR